jgi:spermidine synthase
MADRRDDRWLLACLLLSGMSGLVYEVAWVRSLELIFGATTFAIATVLASFMGGLAAGSAAAGAWEARLRRRHPLRLYAACEAGIAVTALLVPLAFRLLVPMTRGVWEVFHASFTLFSLLRFLLCAAVLLVPTALMGATLPILSRYVAAPRADQPGARASEPARRVGLLYAVNTAGAVAGCALAGLVLMPGLGLVGTQCAAVTLNLAAAAGALLVARRRPFVATAAPTEIPASAERAAAPTGYRPTLFILAYALSGGVAMLYEVAWSRSLVLVLGSSTYAYTTMLTTFLVGLTAGAWVGARVLRTSIDPLLAIGLCQLLTAVTTALGLFTAGELPYLYVRLAGALNPTARGFLGLQLLLAAAVMFPPTLGLGAMFPLTLGGLGLDSQRAQRLVSRAYAWNTLGAIAGSLLGGFWLLPLLGSRNVLLAGIAVNAAVAFAGVALARAPELRRLPRAALLLLIVAFVANLAVAAPAWRSDVMSSGVFRYADRYRGLDRAEFRRRVRESHGDILFFEEGLTCTISVFRTTRSLTLLNNGKPDASVPPGLLPGAGPAGPEPLGDLPTQVLVGQLPLLLADRIEDVMVIGLGSGVTLGSVLTHPVKHVDALELEAAVVHGSRFFDRHSGAPLEDPRVSLVVNDARNDLLVRDRQYDVILSEPSNPWIPGAASLFTRDFFRIARSRLRPEGVLCQWLQLYEMWPEDFQAILRSFQEVFPAVQIWRVGSDAILLGGPRDLPLRVGPIFARASERVRADLGRIGIHGPEDLLAHFWIGGDELRAAVPPGPLNTDDNMRIEFAAPLRMLARDPDRLDRQRSELGGMFRGKTTGALPLLRFPEPPAGVEAPQTAEAAREARFLAGLARASATRGFFDAARTYAAAAWERARTPETATARAVVLADAGRAEEAAAARADAERGWPRDSGVRRMLLEAAVAEGDPAAIRAHAEVILALERDDAPARYELAKVLSEGGDERGALRTLEPLAARLAGGPANKGVAPDGGADHPPDGTARLLGILLAGAGRSAEAEPLLRAHLAAHPGDAPALAALARVVRDRGNDAEAIALERRLAPDAPEQAAARFDAGQRAFEAGGLDEARAALEAALQYAPDHEGAALLLARTVRRAGDRRQAAALLEAWVATHPDRPLAVGLLSQLLTEAGRSETASATAARYRALTGEDWAAVDDDGPAS